MTHLAQKLLFRRSELEDLKFVREWLSQNEPAFRKLNPVHNAVNLSVSFIGIKLERDRYNQFRSFTSYKPSRF
jgi:hypothetical protein